MLGIRPLLVAALLALLPPVAEAAKVNVIRPPKRHVIEAPAPVANPPLTVRIVILVEPVESRASRAERKIFQRWTGFHRQYSGRRYPF